MGQIVSEDTGDNLHRPQGAHINAQTLVTYSFQLGTIVCYWAIVYKKNIKYH